MLRLEPLSQGFHSLTVIPRRRGPFSSRRTGPKARDDRFRYAMQGTAFG
ncbi:MAG: hypothetical protein J6Y79_04545 [Paludibacteraceae bacterium]|nr:hypothetical protein [Paludibacteraceae bacterium]